MDNNSNALSCKVVLLGEAGMTKNNNRCRKD